MRQAAPTIAPTGDILDNLASFRRHLLAANLSQQTIRSYHQAVSQLAHFLGARGMPQDVASLTREHVESFISDLLERWKPATASTRYRGLKVFFKWLLEEGEITADPMARTRPPKVPESPVEVLREAELKALMRTCEPGSSFGDRRDAALLRILIDTGVRRGELVGLRWDPSDDTNNDVDLDAKLLRVMGKGRRERIVPIGHRTVKAIDRYLRSRAKHWAAETTSFFLGHKGPLSSGGVFQIVQRRGQQAGLGDIHPHQLRHSFAHAWLSEGGAEGDLMRITGWKSRDMLTRYAASTGAERAAAAHAKLGLGDRV